MEVVITSPSLDTTRNVSGISSVVAVIMSNDRQNEYQHFQIGKADNEHRGIRWFGALLRTYIAWLGISLAARRRILHFNMALDSRSLIRDTPMILVARTMQRRIVVHVHGGKLLEELPATPWLRWVVRNIILGRHPTIVLGTREATLLRDASNKATIIVLPNCVDLENARTFTRKFTSTEPLSLLFMGRIAPGKGLDIICDALRILRERGCRVKFVLAGAGPDRERYVSSLQSILGTDFSFAGVVVGEQKAALLRASDVFVLPSLFEGLPMALLESMAFGLVPITTAVGSIGEVVTTGKNGILLDTHSADELADAIAAVAADSAMRERLSANARQFVFEHHDPISYVTRLNEIYRHE